MNKTSRFSSGALNQVISLGLWVLFAAVAARGQTSGTFQWNGAVSSVWGNSANWAAGTGLSTGPAPVNGTYNARLNVTNGPAGQELVYDSSLGYTTYANTSNGTGNRGFVIGSVKPGTLRITGGTLSTVGSGPSADAVGNQTGTGTLIIDGGNYISSAAGLALGAGSGICIFTVTNGSAAVTTIGYNLVNGSGFPAMGTINLNGGTLTVSNFAKQGTGGTNFLNFNGGVLKAANDNTTFLTNFLARASVRDKGAIIDTAGYNITISQSLLHSTNSTDNAVDGGVTKLGSGTLTLTATNSYTGATAVKGGTLSEPLPQTSSSLIVASGATFVAFTTNFAWSMAAANLTNATVELNYRNWSLNGYTNAVLNITNLALSGASTINVSGTGFPITNLTLLTYGTKTGGGSIALGTLPSGTAATLTDTGSALVLHITAPSIQNLTWTAVSDNVWQVNGLADWNPAGSTYLEYSSGTGDVVIFDDTYTGGTVSIAGVVNPASITVNNTANSYTFGGSGQIGGSTGISKSGTNTLTLSNSNSFTGLVTVTAGILFIGNAAALGATNGGAVVSGGGTVEIGTAGAMTVSGESISISGAGAGGALGAVRGYGAGPNVWAGPVVVASQSARIGTEANGNLTVSGNITDNGANYELFVRPGASGTVTISGANNSFGSTRFFSDTAAKATLKVGANNALSTNQLTMGPGYLDLNGYNQTVSGIVDVSGSGVVTNNGASASVLTINGNSATNSTSSSIQDGASQISVLKTGTGRQNLKGVNTYTGSTTVNAGELDVVLPMSSTALRIGSGAILSVTTSNRSWSVSAMSVTNGNLVLNFGKISGTPQTPLNTTILNVSGINTINLTATNIAIGQIVLIAYGNKSGAGTFQLGTLPDNVQATMADTGSAIVLNVSFAPQTLTWWGGVTGSWNTNGTLDWSAGSATYQEYAPGVGDVVVFDDSASAFSVIISNAVHPCLMTVSNNLNAYTIAGVGAIAGTNALVKNGTNSLTFTNANSYSGDTTINAGMLLVNNSAGSGTGSGNVIVSSGGTLRGSGTIGGSVTVNSGGTFAPGTAFLAALTISNSVSLSGTANFRINKSGLSLTNDAILGVTSVTAGGQLTVTATGDALAASDSFALFNRGVGAGWFTNLTLPTLAAGLAWDTNDLASNGALDVYTFTATPLAVAVRTNIPALISAAKLANHLGSSRAAAVYPTGWTASVTTAPTNGITSLAGGALTYTATAPNAVEDHFNITFGDGHGWQSMAVGVSIAAQNVSSTVASFTITPAGNFVLSASGMPSTSYDIQAADSVGGPWATIGSATAASNGVLTFTDSDASNHSSRYYRLRQQ